MNVFVFCGGPSSEHDVSLMSATEILKHINKDRYDVSLVYIDRDSRVRVYETEALHETLKDTLTTDPTISFDSVGDTISWMGEQNDPFAFIAAMHGEFGEDGTLQKLLTDSNIPYSGSDSESSALAMDKDATAQKVSHIEGMKIPQSARISAKTLQTWNIYPAFVKPNDKGSSVDSFVAQSADDIDPIKHDRYLIQELITGIEASCGVLEKSDGGFVDVPPIEIIPQDSDFFDYDAKYVAGKSLEITPPKNISPEISDTLVQLAQKIHSTLGCRTFSRSDFIIRGADIYYLETNTLPGFTSNSLLPKEAQAAGITYSELIDFIIDNSP